MTFGLSVAGAAEADDGEPADPTPDVDLPPRADPATEEAVETVGIDVTGVVGDGACPWLGDGTAGGGSPGIVGSGTAAGGGGAGLGGVGLGGVGLGGAGTTTGGAGMTTGGAGMTTGGGGTVTGGTGGTVTGGTVTGGTGGTGTCAAAAPASRQEPTRTVVAAAIFMPS